MIRNRMADLFIMYKKIRDMVTVRLKRYNYLLNHQLSRRRVNWDDFPELLPIVGKIGSKAVDKIIE